MVLTDVGCTREEGNRRCVWGTNCSLSLENNLRGEDTSVNHTMLCVRQSRKKILCPHQRLISIFYKIQKHKQQIQFSHCYNLNGA